MASVSLLPLSKPHPGSQEEAFEEAGWTECQGCGPVLTAGGLLCLTVEVTVQAEPPRRGRGVRPGAGKGCGAAGC